MLAAREGVEREYREKGERLKKTRSTAAESAEMWNTVETLANQSGITVENHKIEQRPSAGIKEEYAVVVEVEAGFDHLVEFLHRLQDSPQ